MKKFILVFSLIITILLTSSFVRVKAEGTYTEYPLHEVENFTQTLVTAPDDTDYLILNFYSEFPTDYVLGFSIYYRAGYPEFNILYNHPFLDTSIGYESRICFYDDNGEHCYTLEYIQAYYNDITQYTLEALNNNTSLVNGISVTREEFTDDLTFMDYTFSNLRAISMVLNTDYPTLLEDEGNIPDNQLIYTAPKIYLHTEQIKVNFYDSLMLYDTQNFFYDEDVDIDYRVLEPPFVRDDYKLIGFITSSGIYIDNIRDVTESMLNSEGELNLYTRYVNEEGIEFDSITVTNAPAWIQNPLRLIGLNSYFGYFLIFIFIIVLSVIALASLQVGYTLYMIDIILISTLFYILGLLQIYIFVIIILIVVFLLLYMLKGDEANV